MHWKINVIFLCYVHADTLDLTCVPAYSGEEAILDKDGNQLNVKEFIVKS